MKSYLLCVLCLVGAASSVHAQGWYGYPPYYYGPPQYYYYPGQVYAPPAPVYYGPATYAPPQANIVVSDDPLRNQTAPAPKQPVMKVKRVVQEPTPPAPMPEPVAAPESDHFTMFWNSVAEWARIPGEPRTQTWWINGGYMGAFLKPMQVNAALVTTGSILDPFPGAIGSPNTQVLFGNERIDNNYASGFYVSAGRFLDQERRLSVEGAIFWVTTNGTSTSFNGDGTGEPLLARPVFATDLNRQGAFFNTFPGALDGKINISSRSNLGSAELNARYDSLSVSRFRSDLLLGVRYARLEDRLQIQENVNALAATTIPFNGVNYTSLATSDSFRSINQFIGGQIGGRVAYDHPWFNLAAFGKLGVGATLQQINVNGSTTFLAPGTALTAPGGVLALPSNIGTHHRNVFGLLPELGLNASVKLCDHVRMDMGYSALLWSKVARASSSIDTNVNTGLAPGAPNFGVVTGSVAPTVRFNDEFFWTHTLRVGLEVSY